jgi:hypothetical protein
VGNSNFGFQISYTVFVSRVLLSDEGGMLSRNVNQEGLDRRILEPLHRKVVTLNGFDSACVADASDRNRGKSVGLHSLNQC